MSATITAAEVNKLRKITGAGLMDCKKALQASGGDFDAAIDYLRKKGQKVSAKRADREAKEGVVIALTTDDRRKGYIVHVTAETDFVSKNQEFIDFAMKLAEIAREKDLDSIEALKAEQLDDASVADKLNEMVAKIGEKIDLAAVKRLEGETVVPYIHMGYKIGVLVALNKAGSEDIAKIGKDIAMQVAAMNPVSVSEEDVPEEVKKKEYELGREQAIAEGKPEKIVDRIAEGKLKKFYKDNTLLHQPFVKDSSKTVDQVLRETDKELTVKGFIRQSIG